VLKQDTFSFLPNIEWLKLVGNRTDSIEPGAFNSLTKLRHLEISDNYLRACPRLLELTKVEFLKLSFNTMQTVDELFAGMASDAVNTKLRVLDLSNNMLTSLKANEFSRLVALTRLDLLNNFFDFEEVDESAFGGLLNLRELTFSSLKNISPWRICDFSI
jgi:Leucine-rich repeat (LRR) protein